MRYATLYTQSIVLMLPQVFKITSSKSFSVLPVINKNQMVFLLLHFIIIITIIIVIVKMIVLIMILLQTHVEPLSSRVDCEGSSRQEVERGFELPPAIYQVYFFFFFIAMSAMSLSNIQAFLFLLFLIVFL